MSTKLINHFTIYVSQIVTLYILNLYSAVCQVYLNKNGKKFNVKFSFLIHYDYSVVFSTADP